MRARHRGSRRRPDGGDLLLALVLLPFVVAAVTLFIDVGDRFVAVADIAQTELRTGDVGRHEVLIGPYSRDGWNHPGPVLFYALAVPYRLLGARAIALPLGALLVNAAAILGIALVARRRGGFPLLAVALLGCAVILHAIGPEFARNPWNPYIVVMPFALVLFLTWEMTCGSAWALPVAAGVASFCAQTHIGYAPLTLPLVAGGGIALLGRARARPTRREGSRRHLAWAGAWTVVVMAVLWLPPLIQQLRPGEGNLREVLRYFESSGEHHTWAEGARTVSSQLALLPEWVTGNREVLRLVGEPTFLSHPPPPLLLVPLILVVALLARHRHADGLRLAAVVAAAMALGAASVVRTAGPALDYRLRWNSWVGMTAAVLTVWGAWEVTPPAIRQRWSRAAGALVVAAIGLLTTASAVNSATAGVPYARESSVARTLLDDLDDTLPRGGGVVVVSQADAGGGTYLPAAIRAFERRGVPVRVEGGQDRYGEHRLLGPDEAVRARLVITGDRFDELRSRRDLRLVRYWGTLGLRERERRVERVRRIRAAFDAGRIDAEELLRATQAADTGSAVGIFLERGP